MERSTLSKSERVCRRKDVEELFAPRRTTVMAYPLRAIYCLTPRTEGAPAVKILLSVPKRYVRHAVARNRIKRQLREAYRQRKGSLTAIMAPQHHTLLVAIVWIEKKLYPSREVNKRIDKLLCRLSALVTPPCGEA